MAAPLWPVLLPDYRKKTSQVTTIFLFGQTKFIILIINIIVSLIISTIPVF
nr:hypothetical protein [Vibrio cholerae]